MTDVEVLVVGGGISGLASAWWLGREGLRVEVWEGDDRIGGKVQTRRSGGYTTERSATMVLNFRSEVDALLAESGLDRIKLPRASAGKRYLVHGGRMVAVPVRARIINARVLAEKLTAALGAVSKRLHASGREHPPGLHSPAAVDAGS